MNIILGFSPLPRCTYLNTDIYGDDVGDGKGISTGSAAGCKEACADLEVCQFWTYRDGWARDCYLKRGRRGDPTSSNAVPKVGYVSGTKGDVCICLPNSSNPDEEVCPISYSRYYVKWIQYTNLWCQCVVPIHRKAGYISILTLFPQTNLSMEAKETPRRRRW